MGIAILVLALVIELAFAVICLTTKSSQKRIRSIIYLASLAVFGLAVIVKVVDYSFRWTSLLFLLLIQAIVALAFFIKRSSPLIPFKTSRAILLLVFRSLLMVAVLIPVILFPQYEPLTVSGPAAVATYSETLTDTSRSEGYGTTDENRRITIQFWYPATAAQDIDYPLVVFSHGAFGFRGSNYSTFAELASHGYVVCSIDHTYHSFFTKQTDGRTTIVDLNFMNDAIAVTNQDYDEAKTYELTQTWLDLRVADMNFVLDTILDQVATSAASDAANSTAAESADTAAAGHASTPAADVYSLIDTQKIGLFGHSMGGATSAALGRERNDIDAVIILDGTMLGEAVDFQDGAEVLNQEAYPVPLLDVFAEDHYNQALANPESYANMVAGKNGLDTRRTVIYGSGHLNFTDLPLFSPALAKQLGTGTIDPRFCIETMNHIVLEYFDTYLKGDAMLDVRDEYRG